MIKYFIFVLGVLVSALAKAEMGVPIQLRLKSPGGTYPTEAGINIKVMVLSPSSCILREENFSAQTVNNGNISLALGTGSLGTNDAGLSLNQVYDNSKTKTGLFCVDASNNVVAAGQTYTPAASDLRIIRVATVVSSDIILVNFNMRATPYAIQAESVGGKVASEIIVNDPASQMNQTNLNDLLQSLTTFNNLKNLAVNGQAATSVNFSGSLAGDVSGTQGAVSVNKIKGVAVSATAPVAGQVLQYNGAQYVPSTPAAAAVTSVAGRTGAVTLANTDISGLGGAAILNVGSTAGTVAAGNDARIVNALQFSTAHSGDVSGTFSALSVDKIKGVGVSSAAPVNGDVLQYNGTQYVPVAIPSAPVSSVAGRTGAVTLANTDISGLGGAALLNVGTTAGTVAAGNDARLVNALQTSSVHSGDVSGAYNVLSVDRIKGTPVSGAASVSGQVLQYNGSQYVPTSLAAAPVTSVAGKTGVVTLVSSDISGLGGAALLNVGTTAGTVAAGNDARITGALAAATFNGYVSSAACTTSQSLYWNSVSSQFLCQAISFPAAPVTSVAGRTGAVTLVSSDISGLGTAALLNVGTAANNIPQLDAGARIPASELPANALTTSTVYSGDVSGSSAALSVDRIKGTAVSATAPVAGQALVYNGSQWVPTTGFPIYARSTADQIFSTTAVTNATQLLLSVSAGVTYKYKFSIMYTSAATTTGLRLGLTYPAVTSATGLANIASGADGTGAYFQGVINFSGDSVMSLNTPSASPNVEFAVMEGIIVPSTSGILQLTAATEVAGSNVVIKAGSFGELVIIP